MDKKVRVFVRKGRSDHTRIVSFAHEGFDIKKLRALGFIPDGNQVCLLVDAGTGHEIPTLLEQAYQSIETVLNVELEFA